MRHRDHAVASDGVPGDEHYGVIEQLYVDEVRPTETADIVIDNRDFEHPAIEPA